MASRSQVEILSFYETHSAKVSTCFLLQSRLVPVMDHEARQTRSGRPATPSFRDIIFYELCSTGSPRIHSFRDENQEQLISCYVVSPNDLNKHFFKIQVFFLFFTFNGTCEKLENNSYNFSEITVSFDLALIREKISQNSH